LIFGFHSNCTYSRKRSSISPRFWLKRLLLLVNYEETCAFALTRRTTIADPPSSCSSGWVCPRTVDWSHWTITHCPTGILSWSVVRFYAAWWLSPVVRSRSL